MKKAADIVAIVLFVTMFGVFLLQIFTRYVIGNPLGWTVEICVVLYIWIVFWSAAFLLRERDHVAFTIVVDALPPSRRRFLAIIGAGVIFVTFASAFPAIVDYVTFMRIDKTPVSGIRFDWVYSIFCVFSVAVVVRSGILIRRLLGRNWMAALNTEIPPKAPSSK